MAHCRLARALAALCIATGWVGCRTAVPVPDERPPLRAFEADGRSSATAFFRAPLLSHVAISPDGRHLAAIASHGRRDTLVVLSLDGGESRALTKIERVDARARRSARWAGAATNGSSCPCTRRTRAPGWCARGAAD